MMPEAFLELGSEMILCSEKEKCEGIKNSKDEGIIPRVLILSTLQGEPSREKAKIGIFGINPGPHLPFERLYYTDILKKHGLFTSEYSKSNAIKAFKEIHDTWVSEFIKNYRNYPFHYKYFANTLEFLKKAKDCFNLREEVQFCLEN
ncbi:hypothetical protein PFDSM3638_04510 [Pyrococcus furiosus DSM 3638]|uniref:Uncharacterized protein n=2 Tax=Pyrococcus furiosus TaxID=2261 RepID=A0A5C0XUW0_PYRFU|nr:hypothetical protein [Pyrococcus furiosus]AFN03694.1 hypothetical protein PFC_03725 [Pyrococcus furiosus COM1]QEK78570.1 hypothetical protein PFDSM3638_04510 [Pyrococcus furiosus DSM 3638]